MHRCRLDSQAQEHQCAPDVLVRDSCIPSASFACCLQGDSHLCSFVLYLDNSYKNSADGYLLDYDQCCRDSARFGLPAKRRGVAPTRAASAFFAIPRSAGPQTIRLPHLTYACAIESRSKDADFLTLLPASVVQRTVLAESGLIRNSKALTTHEILGLAIQIHGGLRIADCD